MFLTRTQLAEIQTKLGIVFKDTQLLELALTHRSFLNERPTPGLQHNERLEFLGDAVLEIAVTTYLYKRLPDAPEGLMTNIRSAMVSWKSLVPIIEEFGIGAFMLMSKGERKSFGHNERATQVILANAFEALLGAMFLDRGMGVVELFLGGCLFPKLPAVIQEQTHLDPKSYFQEVVQERWSVTPRYEVVEESGPAHNRMFVCVAIGADGVRMGKGTGPSKAEAEIEAARDALNKEFQIVLNS